MPDRIKYTLLGLLGFLLSPLSWWNDAFVNLPLAYLFAIPFGWISRSLFLPALVTGYWLTNVIGLVLMHTGVHRLADGRLPPMKWLTTIMVSLAYTVLLTVLVLSGWLKTPWEYFTVSR